MKILAHIHTLNDEDVIERCIHSLMEQTFPVQKILLVDNASTDDTLNRSFPKLVTVVKHKINLGTSGSVDTGFRYALEKGYEWIWIMDADSIASSDALGKLMELYKSFPSEDQERIGVLCSRIIRGPAQQPDDYGLLTPKGPRAAKIDPSLAYYECDSAIWSGSLFNLRAVRDAKYPRYGPAGYWDDFSLDWGDIEYFYRVRLAGYKVLVHRSSFIRHRLGWQKQMSLFGQKIISTNHPIFRRYLYFRNGVYFWFYIYPDKNHFFITLYLATHIISQITKILLLEEDRWAKIRAILRGGWDGLNKKLQYCYGS